MTHTIIARGMKLEIPEYIIYRGKRYEVMSSHSTYRPHALEWAESDRKRGHKTIVKTFPTKEKGIKVYVLYRHRPTKVYNQKTGKAEWEKR
jgi:hypothetical protein